MTADIVLPNTVEPSECPEFKILGVRVNAVQISTVIALIERWIERRDGCRYIAVTDMHSLMVAQHSQEFKTILANAALTVPDGMPLVWLGRHQGFPLPERVCGPELMMSFCAETSHKNYRHFFYGGAPGVAHDLANRLAVSFPGLQIVGTHCPPFRPLTLEEDREVLETINRSHADIVWVGLGAPKQERWMFEHRDSLNVPALLGVGAAFDFHTGRVARAPVWMRKHGLEWLFRLFQEPRRLWKRYLVHGPQFAILALLEITGWKKFH